MRERKQCGFFEHFRQGLEGEGAGAVPEAKQEKRRRDGRDGGRGVISSFIITRTVTVLLRSGNDYDSAREKIWQASYDMRKLQDCKPKTNSLYLLFTIRIYSSNF